MLFDTVPVRNELVRSLADSVRTLDFEFRRLRQRVAMSARITLAEFDALVTVSQSDDPVTPKQLASVLGLTTSATTAVLDRLETAALVARRPHPHDRRSLVVALQPRGEEIMTDLYARFVEVFEPIAAGDACPGDIANFVTLLQCLTSTVADAHLEAAEPTRLAG